jgi:predicted DNA-binding antitoxin AbrB/MazE fold protein
MTIMVAATYEDGVLKPAEPLALAEHQKVLLTVEPQCPATAAGEVQTTYQETPELSLGEQIAAMARALPSGALDNLPEDLASQHDHYLYGTPKRSR